MTTVIRWMIMFAAALALVWPLADPYAVPNGSFSLPWWILAFFNAAIALRAYFSTKPIISLDHILYIFASGIILSFPMDAAVPGHRLTWLLVGASIPLLASFLIRRFRSDLQRSNPATA